jgi:hypothetical protein
MTKEEKAEYNRKYYQEHKEEYWGVKGDGYKSPTSGTKMYVSTGSFVSSDGKRAIPTYRELTPNEVKGRSVPSTAREFHQKWDARLTDYLNRARVSTALSHPADAARAATGDTFNYKVDYAKKLASDLFSRQGAKAVSELATDAGRVAINKGKSIVKSFTSFWKLGWK